MSWITENPWPLMLILAGTALVLLIVGESKCRGFAVGCAEPGVDAERLCVTRPDGDRSAHRG